MAIELNRYFRQVTPSGSAGQAMVNPEALAQPAQANAALGHVVTQAGLEFAQRLDEAIAINQLSQFKLSAKQTMAGLDLGDDPEQYQTKFQETLGKIKSEALSKVTNSRARQNAELWLGDSEIDWQSDVQRAAAVKVAAVSKATFDARRKYAMESLDMDELQSAYQEHSDQFESEQVRDLELRNDLQELRTEAEKEAKNAQIEQGYSAAVGILDNGGSADQAIEAGKQFIPAQDRQEFESEINALHQSKIEKEEQARQQIQSETVKQLSDLLGKGELTIGDVRGRRDLFVDEEKYKAWTQIALTPISKKGNEIQAAILNAQADDVWRESVTIDEFLTKLNDSMADEGGINQTQWSQIYTNAQTEIDKGRAEDLRTYYRRAADVILGQYAGLLQFDSNGNLSGINLANLSGSQVEDAKYRLHYLSLYQDELKNFALSKKDTLTSKELYQEAAALKMKYWNTSLETMKNIASQQGRQPEGAQLQHPQPKTKEEFDALPFNAIFIDPDGVKRRKQ